MSEALSFTELAISFDKLHKGIDSPTGGQNISSDTIDFINKLIVFTKHAKWKRDFKAASTADDVVLSKAEVEEAINALIALNQLSGLLSTILFTTLNSYFSQDQF